MQKIAKMERNSTTQKAHLVFCQTRKVNLKKPKELFFPTAQKSVHLNREEQEVLTSSILDIALKGEL